MNLNQWNLHTSLFLMALVLIGFQSFAQNFNPVPIRVDVSNQAKLQRGAQLFMNYCSGCHALRYLRYNRMAKDLGLTKFDGSVDSDLLMSNLVFTEARPHDPIQISMPEVDARQWFGRMPPDLSLSARERSPGWLYLYLKSFYADKTRPFGSNNALVPDVGMPNVLAPLQGEVVALKKKTNETGGLDLLLIQSGEMNQQQFDSALQDLVTFLVYVSEPNQLTRYRLGLFVLVFLCIFAALAYALKKIYWRRV